jgi:hypothetical protein
MVRSHVLAEEAGGGGTVSVEPHVCDYTAGFCRLPGVHGGVPDPEPHLARADDFTVSASGNGDLELRCAHYGIGCWWSTDLTNEDTLAVLALMAREHLAAAHRPTIEATVVTTARALPESVVPPG